MAGVARRSLLRGAQAPEPRFAARSWRRARAGRMGVGLLLTTPRPAPPAMGDGARGGPRRRPLGACHQDTPLHGRRRRHDGRRPPAARRGAKALAPSLESASHHGRWRPRARSPQRREHTDAGGVCRRVSRSAAGAGARMERAPAKRDPAARRPVRGSQRASPARGPAHVRLGPGDGRARGAARGAAHEPQRSDRHATTL